VPGSSRKNAWENGVIKKKKLEEEAERHFGLIGSRSEMFVTWQFATF